MRITNITPPITEIQFLNAGRGAGGYYVDTLPIHWAEVDALPAGLDAIVVTADLQGREMPKKYRYGRAFDGTPPRLLGEVLPKQLRESILPDGGISNGRVGAVLAGDFYTVPLLDRRGGTGDVTEVWKAFSDWFEWVVGVGGNHDMYGTETQSARPRVSSRVTYLDGDFASVDKIQFAGLSGIIGNPKRHMRRDEDAYCRAIEELLFQEPDILVTHDGPNCPELRQRGSDRVRQQLEQFEPILSIRGHAHWNEPLVTLAGGTQVLNVDARVVVLTPGR